MSHSAISDSNPPTEIHINYRILPSATIVRKRMTGQTKVDMPLDARAPRLFPTVGCTHLLIARVATSMMSWYDACVSTRHHKVMWQVPRTYVSG